MVTTLVAQIVDLKLILTFDSIMAVGLASEACVMRTAGPELALAKQLASYKTTLVSMTLTIIDVVVTSCGLLGRFVIVVGIFGRVVNASGRHTKVVIVVSRVLVVVEAQKLWQTVSSLDLEF